MTRSDQTFIFLSIVIMGIWGCSQGGQSPGASAADRLKALEVKSAKLEDDFRAVAAARDQLRHKLAAAEEAHLHTQQQLEERIASITQERNDLEQQLAARTTERDGMAIQFEQFRKSLKDLIGQAEAAISRPTEPIGSTVEVIDPNKS
jgi:chromosome segregation ATPase